MPRYTASELFFQLFISISLCRLMQRRRRRSVLARVLKNENVEKNVYSILCTLPIRSHCWKFRRKSITIFVSINARNFIKQRCTKADSLRSN